MRSLPEALVIGDVHGRLRALAGLLHDVELLDGGWDDIAAGRMPQRLRPEVRIVALGDLADLDRRSRREADVACYDAAVSWGLSVVDGNHDRALVDAHHRFDGYDPPAPAVRARLLAARSRILIGPCATAAGWLISHAGLHPALVAGWSHPAAPVDLTDADQIRRRVMRLCAPRPAATTRAHGTGYVAVRDAIGHRRGGHDPAGGLLWRDVSEPVLTTVQQVFGHSPGRTVRWAATSVCIDIGTQLDNRLAGLWLPQRQLHIHE